MLHTSDKFGALKLDRLADLQVALAFLGYDPGSTEGEPDPHTTEALFEFQADLGLAVDGTPTPATRAALVKALNSAAAAS